MPVQPAGVVLLVSVACSGCGHGEQVEERVAPALASVAAAVLAGAERGSCGWCGAPLVVEQVEPAGSSGGRATLSAAA
jgi:hypothetical protein